MDRYRGVRRYALPILGTLLLILGGVDAMSRRGLVIAFYGPLLALVLLGIGYLMTLLHPGWRFFLLVVLLLANAAAFMVIIYQWYGAAWFGMYAQSEREQAIALRFRYQLGLGLIAWGLANVLVAMPLAWRAWRSARG